MKLSLAFLPLFMITWAIHCQATSSQECRQDNFEQCRNIILANGSKPSQHQKSILRELCDAGHYHRKDKGHGTEQFAMMNINSDSNSDKAQWDSGVAENVICEPEWLVDEVIPMRPGYNFRGSGTYYWYKHGISMWPICGQSLKSHGLLKRCLFRCKTNWPNYALVTPLYWVQKECNNKKDPLIAMGKRFDRPNNFSDLAMLRVFVKSVMAKFLDANGNECKKPIQTVNDYEKWLQPFILESLKSMIQSAKKSNDNGCPHELYIFIRRNPKEFQEEFASKLFSDLNSILEKVSCSKETNTVIGWHP